VGALEPGGFPGLSELCSAGGCGTAAAKPAKDSNRQPGFSTKNVVVTGVSLISAGYDVPHARTFQEELITRVSGAKWRGVRRIRLHVPTGLWNVLFYAYCG